MKPSDAHQHLALVCGALFHDFTLLTQALPGVWRVLCLPARLHNHPEQIPERLRAALLRLRTRYERVIVGYADCGTMGGVAAVCEAFGAEYLPGEHCYAALRGRGAFNASHYAEPGQFYLTDYTVRHFDRLIFQPLGLDRHPQLRDVYFAHYTCVTHLRQGSASNDAAAACAAKLGLPLRTVEIAPNALCSYFR